jgi:Ni/Fe-hydrogenase subunit HybB-like protein
MATKSPLLDPKGEPVLDPMIDPRTGEYAVIAPGHNFKSVTQKIAGIVLTTNTPLGWFGGMIVAGGVASLVAVALTWLFLKGVGIWGVTIPGAWGFAIINFVWWIGIGHAGTLISAILLLFKQTWRNSINRFAEAMTIFAVCCAGIFPLIHVGRPWVSYWLFPYPNTMNVWPQFRSPLAWDVFAVSTYATISVVFWYIGMIPDFGTLRDRAVLATPLVLSVHTVISFDFAVAAMAGWHTTIFPPYFVAGAIYSGFAMVLTLAIPIRKFYHLEDLITLRHLDNMAKVMLGTGCIVGYGYGMEVFISWYSASHWEFFMMWNRMFGPMGWAYWILILTNLAIPLTTLWSRKLRVNVVYLFILSFIVNTGMWFERFVIVVTSLYRDYLPSSWGTYRATRWDYMTFVGTWGLFTFLFLLFVRFLPMIPMSEIRMMLPQTKIRRGGEDAESVIEETV